jgi:HAD superfamily hydrolase (TIGR01509 family)
MTATLAVGFDFDHTLGLDNGLEVIAFYRLGAELGHSLSEKDVVWANIIANILFRFREAAISLDAAVDEFVARLGFAPEPACADRYRRICYELVDELVTPIDGAREVIAALTERNIRSAILTNGWSPLQSLKIARALDYRGPVLVSDELGILKPAAAAFEKLVETLGVERERIVFVGDNPHTDILGARNAGLRSVWFDWEHISYPPGLPEPDIRIEHLHDLLDILRGAAVSTEN